MVLEWDKDPVFISWPEQPTFRTIKMSKLMDDMSILRPKQYLRVNMDVDVSYEESTMIKEEFCKTYELRELVLLSDKKSEMIEDSEQLVVASVDQTIVTQIVNFQSEKFDNNLLLNIYTGL